jgi:lipid-binding SYLF domain-containing protein
MTLLSKLKYAGGLSIAVVTLLLTTPEASASLTSDARAALRQLIAQNPAAHGVSEKALGVLVFPNVVKAGFIFGGQSGQGILFYGDKAAGRYRTTAASYGLQAGAQKFGYALFFMNQKALDWVNAAHGWSIGSAPSLVVVDQGMARTMSTETLHSGIYAFTFDQRGLMGGIGIQGSKIQRLD